MPLPTGSNYPAPRGQITRGALAACAWTSSIVSLSLLVLVFVESAGGVHLPGKEGWADAALLLATAVATLIWLSRELPGQNVLAAAFIIGAIATIADAINSWTAIPFGERFYTRAVGPRILSTTAWSTPFLWIVIILNSRGTARLILRPWRKVRSYGYRVLALTIILSTLFDLSLEPFATRVKGFWVWNSTRFRLEWCGAPLTSFLGWAVVTTLILAFVTPFLINKRPVSTPPSFHPLAVLVLASALIVTAAALAHLWLPAMLCGIAALAVAALAFRGATW